MPYVFIDPLDYYTGKPVSFEEYRQLIDNANQAYNLASAILTHGFIRATRAALLLNGATVTGATPGPYTWTVPAGVTRIKIRGVAGGGGGVNNGTGGAATSGGTSSVVGSSSGTLASATGGGPGGASSGGTGNDGTGTSGATGVSAIGGRASLLGEGSLAGTGANSYGGGGTAGAAAGSTSGGGGGGFDRTVTVVPGETITITVGAGGSGNISGNPGGPGFVDIDF